MTNERRLHNSLQLLYTYPTKPLPLHTCHVELDNLADLLLGAHLALVETLVPGLGTTERGGVCLVKESNNWISPVILKLTQPLEYCSTTQHNLLTD